MFQTEHFDIFPLGGVDAIIPQEGLDAFIFFNKERYFVPLRLLVVSVARVYVSRGHQSIFGSMFNFEF